MTQYINNVDGTVNYTNDPTSQLTGADYTSESLTDETYVYDANGNRTNNGCVIAANNRLISDGTYTYGYDDEGNCTTRINILTGATTRFTWDYRNRLVQIAEYPSATSSTATKTVQNAYDVFNRWVKRVEDSDGDGAIDTTDVFVHDENQIVLQFATGQGDSSFIKNSHRYLWGPSVDQLLADEALTYAGALFPSSLYPLVANSPRWPLCDHLNTVRDLASYDSASDATSILNHRIYSAFGELLSETNSTYSCLFTFTSKPLDVVTGLLDYINRKYDPPTGRWLSEDPIGYEAEDMNLYRYVANGSLVYVDPTGLQSWIGAGYGAIPNDSNGTCRNLPISYSVSITFRQGDWVTTTVAWWNYLTPGVALEVNANKKVDWKSLLQQLKDKLGPNDCISDVSLAGHGGFNSAIDATTLADDKSDMHAFFAYLGSRTCSGNGCISLRACCMARDHKELMLNMASVSKTKVRAWDDWYRVVPYGKEFTAYPDKPTIEQTGDTGRTYEGTSKSSKK